MPKCGGEQRDPLQKFCTAYSDGGQTDCDERSANVIAAALW